MRSSFNEVTLAQRWFLKCLLCSHSISFHSDGEQEVLWQVGSRQLKPNFFTFLVFFKYLHLKLKLQPRLNTNSQTLLKYFSRHANDIEELNNDLKSNLPQAWEMRWGATAGSILINDTDAISSEWPVLMVPHKEVQ